MAKVAAPTGRSTAVKHSSKVNRAVGRAAAVDS
jgi:hypothetical protein